MCTLVLFAFVGWVFMLAENGSGISGVVRNEPFPDHTLLPTGAPFDS